MNAIITASLLIATQLSLPPTIDLKDIKKGQEGECQTVFEGHTIEPFPFIVKAVMENYLGPGRHLILIRLNDARTEHTGVVSGMSGSPCSINGRLAGALSYAFASFAKEPIAGVTPIADMEAVWDLKKTNVPWKRQHHASQEEWQALRDGTVIARAPSENLSTPISTPLNLSGFTPETLSHFSPWLESQGFVPLAGGSTGKSMAENPLAPGSAIAAVLVHGDVSIAATGTVTAVDNTRVLAFGHPFLGVGPLSIPMAQAEIVNTMVSARRSFKMSITGPSIGELSQDRLPAIAGRIGAVPAMIPVKGRIKTAEGLQTFSFEVARDTQLTPRFLAMGLAAAISGRINQTQRGLLRLSATLTSKNFSPLHINKIYSTQRHPKFTLASAIDVAQYASVLWSTPFGPPPDLSVNVDLSIENEPYEEWIESAHVTTQFPRPGQKLDVIVKLRQVDGPFSEETLSITVPKHWAGKRVVLSISNAQQAEQVEGLVSGALVPETLSDIRRWLEKRRHEGRIYLLAVRQGIGLQIGVDNHPFLPPSIVTTLANQSNRNLRTKGIELEIYKTRPGIVLGSAVIPIDVQPTKR